MELDATVWPPATLALLTKLLGTWRYTPIDPAAGPLAEVTYEPAFNGKALRSRGIVGIGRPQPSETESIVGWDPDTATIYYFEFHGGVQVYQGTMVADDTMLISEFHTLIGEELRYRAVDEFMGSNMIDTRIFAQQDGKWVEHFAVTMRRVTE